MLFLVIVTVVEGIMRIYEAVILSKQESDNFKSMVFKNIDDELWRNIKNEQIKYTFSDMLLLSPNQKLKTINVNSFGFRGPEITLEKPANTYRIFIIGGSTLFGAGATSDETTIPGYIQTKFDELDLDFSIEVINAGIPNADSKSETFYMKDRLLDFHPDLFIVYGGWNDAHHDWGWDEKDVKKNILRSIYHSLKLELNHFYHVYIKLVYRTPIIFENMQTISVDEKLDKGQRKLEQNLVLPDVTLRPKKITIWEERWLEICQLGNEKNNFKTIVTIQPVLGTGNKPLIEEESERLFKESERQFLLLDTLAGFAETLNELEKTCIKTVDLRNVFDNTPEPVYFDQGHMSDFGNEIVAQRLFEIALPIIEKPK